MKSKGTTKELRSSKSIELDEYNGSNKSQYVDSLKERRNHVVFTAKLLQFLLSREPYFSCH